MGTAMQALRKMALRFRDVDEGVACEGTPLERRTVKVAKKAFVFLGAGDAMLKLDRSLPAARALARKTPARFRVGAGGWVKVTFSDADPPPMDVLAKWIAESHALASSGKTTSKRRK